MLPGCLFYLTCILAYDVTLLNIKQNMHVNVTRSTICFISHWDNTKYVYSPGVSSDVITSYRW